MSVGNKKQIKDNKSKLKSATCEGPDDVNQFCLLAIEKMQTTRLRQTQNIGCQMTCILFDVLILFSLDTCTELHDKNRQSCLLRSVSKICDMNNLIRDRRKPAAMVYHQLATKAKSYLLTPSQWEGGENPKGKSENMWVETKKVYQVNPCSQAKHNKEFIQHFPGAGGCSAILRKAGLHHT